MIRSSLSPTRPRPTSHRGGCPARSTGTALIRSRTFSADAAAMMNLSEVIVHTWDIATALGADATIEPAVAEMLYQFYRPMSLDPYRAHGAFGAEVVVDSDAPPAQRLLALLG